MSRKDGGCVTTLVMLAILLAIWVALVLWVWTGGIRA